MASGLHFEDGVASANVPGRFLATIHLHGPGRRSDATHGQDSFDVQAKLLIDGNEVASQTISLESGQQRQIEFTHQFPVLSNGRKPGSSVATIDIQSDVPSIDRNHRDNRHDRCSNSVINADHFR